MTLVNEAVERFLREQANFRPVETGQSARFPAGSGGALDALREPLVELVLRVVGAVTVKAAEAAIEAADANICGAVLVDAGALRVCMLPRGHAMMQHLDANGARFAIAARQRCERCGMELPAGGPCPIDGGPDAALLDAQALATKYRRERDEALAEAGKLEQQIEQLTGTKTICGARAPWSGWRCHAPIGHDGLHQGTFENKPALGVLAWG